MAVLIGSFIGAMLCIYLVATLVEWAVLKRVLDDPVQGKVGAVVIALAIAEAAYWYAGRGSAFYPIGAGMYALAALIEAGLAYFRGLKSRERILNAPADTERLDETFGRSGSSTPDSLPLVP